MEKALRMTHKKLSYRIGNFLGLVILLLAIYSIIVIIKEDHDYSELIDYSFMVIVAVFFFITSRFPIGKYVQVIGLCLTAAATVLTDPNLDYFILQLVIVYLLAEKYGFWKDSVLLKLTISLIIISILLVLSYITIERSLDDMISTLQFYLIFVVSFSLIKLDDMRSYFENIKKLKSEITELNTELMAKDKILESLDPDFINPVEAGLTKAELKLLENLCLYRESNQELSVRLGKSENTIKTQLKSITQKIGVDNRHQLIEACKDYFYALKI